MTSQISRAALLASLAVLSSSVMAYQIDPSAFDASEQQDVSFTNLPLSFGRPGPVIVDGTVFESGGGSFRTYPAKAPYPDGPSVQICAERGCIMTDIELDFITVTLPTPASLVGAYLGITNSATTAVAKFYAGSTLLGAVGISAQPNEGVFAGWNAGAPLITSVVFVDNQDQEFVLGLAGFTYQITPSVPEPSAVLQIATGLGVIIFALARRKTA